MANRHSNEGTLIQRGHGLPSLMKYGYILKTSVMDAMVYVVDFFGGSIFFAFIMTIYLLLWRNIYGNEGQMIEGFTLNTMIWYLTMTEIVTISTTNYYKRVSEDIKSGNVAYLLNKPYHYVGYAFFDNMGKVLLRFVINSIVGIAVALLYVGPMEGFELWMVPMVALGLLMGIVLNFFCNFALALTAFWVEENMPFRWIFHKLIFTLGGMLLPLELFPERLGQISRWLPFAYITYRPAKLAVDFSFDGFLGVVAGQTIYGALAILLCLGIYKKGVKALNVNGG